LVITIRTYSIMANTYSPKFDIISTVTNIIDGDTFYIASGGEIRLADVDTPESNEYGYFEASDYLRNLIYNKPVYLNFGNYDKYDRLVCLVYSDYNSTHYLNVNERLVKLHYAEIWDFDDNGFNPYTWSLYLAKPSLDSHLIWLGISTVIGLFMTFIIYRLVLDAVKIATTILYKIRVYINTRD